MYMPEKCSTLPVLYQLSYMRMLVSYHTRSIFRVCLQLSLPAKLTREHSRHLSGKQCASQLAVRSSTQPAFKPIVNGNGNSSNRSFVDKLAGEAASAGPNQNRRLLLG